MEGELGMKKTILYHYLGTNGTILSPVHLEGAYYVRKIQLKADEGKALTKDYIKLVPMVTIPEDEELLWHEVDI